MPVGIDSYPLSRYLINQARGRRRFVRPFTYEVRSGILAASATSFSGAVDLDADAPFLWYGLRGQQLVPTAAGGFRVGAFNAGTLAEATAQIRYGGPGAKAVAQTQLPWKTIETWRGAYMILPAPKLLPAAGRLWVDFTILAAHGFIEYRVQFAGMKVMGWGGK